MDFDDLTAAERTALAHCRQAVLGINKPLRLDCGVDMLSGAQPQFAL